MTEDELYLLSNKELREYCKSIQDKLFVIEDDMRKRINASHKKYSELESLHETMKLDNEKEINRLNNTASIRQGIIYQKNECIRELTKTNDSLENKLDLWRCSCMITSVVLLFTLFIMFAGNH